MSSSRTDASWRPVDTDRLSVLLADWLDAADGAPRVAIDGPPCADPTSLAQSLVEPLRAAGRPTAHIDASSFWHDASLRLEHGREDVESYLTWLDAGSLRRETLEPFAAGAPFLASLRDPRSNRSTHEPPRAFEPRCVLLVSGTFLLGRDLPFDRTIHLFLPAEARARRTPADETWTLPAFEHYDAAVRPADRADVTVRLDRRSPAVRGLSEGRRSVAGVRGEQ